MKEITSWKEDYKRFEDANTEVLAISVDHIYSHNVFAAALGALPYPLLADWHKKVTQKFGVLNEENGTAIRSCFVIDQEGIVQFSNHSFDANEKLQYEEVFKACETCGKGD
ncbi:peroxiredoxin family protein [Fictibacillus sp. 23RED33]|nr:peroxiredoxin family protein [Fictibacillus sp. 23RED33]